MSPKLSLIVPTYNRPRELRLVLEGLRCQSGTDFEVIVADDGSTRETRDLIEEIRRDFPRPLLHVRHEDEGFRAAAIRNRAIEKASGEGLVFLDGDCVPFPGFVEAHDRARERGVYLTGQRLRLDASRSEAIDPQRIAGGGLARLATPWERIKESYERGRALVDRIRKHEERPKLISCNASASMEDVVAINGFDERFVGWGGEDGDFGRRLRRSGLRPKSVIGRARVLHLHHPPVPSFRGKVRLGPNYPYLHRGYFLTRCRDGLERRTIQDLSVHFLGAPDGVPAPGPPGSPGSIDRCEIDVLFSPSSTAARFHQDTEIRVLAIVGPDPDPRLLEECDVVLQAGGAEVDTAGKPSGKVAATGPDSIIAAILESLDPLI